MKITIPVSSVSADVEKCRWHPSVPRVDLEKCYPAVGGFDESEFRRQVRDCRHIQISSDDKGITCAFAAILLASINDWMNDNDSSGRIEDAERVIKRLKKRELKGIVSYANVIISSHIVPFGGNNVRGLKIDIRTDDRLVVQKHDWAHEFALVVADFVREYSNRAVKRGEPAFELSDRVKSLFDELDTRTANSNRKKCKNYHCGICSPSRFDCENYKDGHCVEIEEEPNV